MVQVNPKDEVRVINIVRTESMPQYCFNPLLLNQRLQWQLGPNVRGTHEMSL